MRRRTLLATASWFLTAGCLSADTDGSDADISDSNPSNADENDNQERYDGLKISGVYPEEVDRDFFDGEYVEMENASSSPILMSGVKLVYDDNHEFRFDNIKPPSGSKIIVHSREGEGSIYVSDPPIYSLNAGFGDGPNTSVMEPPGGVSLVSPAASVIDEALY